MAHNHREQPPSRGRGGIPVLVTTARRTGLRSGGPAPGPTAEPQPSGMVIRLPPRTNNRGTPVVLRTAAREVLEPVIQEPAPPSYTEQVGPAATGTPRNERESASDEPVSERSSETDQEEPLSELSTITQGSQELGRSGVGHRNNLCIILCKYSPPEIR